MQVVVEVLDMTREDVREYINNYFEHIIEMTEYGNGFSDFILSYIEEAKTDIKHIFDTYKYCRTKRDYEELQRLIKPVLKKLEDLVSVYISNEVEKLAEEEDEWLDNNIAIPLGIKLEHSEKSKKLLLMIPIIGAGSAITFGESVRKRLDDIYDQILRLSYVSGNSLENAEAEIKTNFLSFQRSVETDSKTIGSSLSGQYDRIIYTKNEGTVKKYMWLSTLDTTTCIVCGELDHSLYNSVNEVPLYPKHPNCRCTVIPVNEDIIKYAPKTYQEWFENLCEQSKKKVLGKKRFEMYKNGFNFKSFVNNGVKIKINDLTK